MSIETLLGKLEKVQKSGNGRWMALCPSHADRGRSLSLRELDDGRILIHCFAGCDTHGVLSAVGLEFSDLMPECLGEKRGERRSFDAFNALKAVRFEAMVLRLLAKNMKDGKSLSTEDRTRAGQAERVIQDALDAVEGVRSK